VGKQKVNMVESTKDAINRILTKDYLTACIMTNHSLIDSLTIETMLDYQEIELEILNFQHLFNEEICQQPGDRTKGKENLSP